MKSGWGKFVVVMFACLPGVTDKSFAQQPPQYSQYIFNNYMINPAVGGGTEYADIKVGYRTQWLGFSAAPQTLFVSAHTALVNSNAEPRPFLTRNHHGVGAYAIQDVTGPVSRLGAYATYAYHVRLGYQLKASLGVAGGMIQYALNGGALTTIDPDPDVVSIAAYTPDAAAGLWFYSDKYFGGVSIQHLLYMNLAGTRNKLKHHYYITGGYVFNTRRGDFIPSAHLKAGVLTPVEIDLSVRWRWEDRFWAGLSYRKNDAVYAIAGINVNNYVEVGYAFDFTLSRLSKYSSNTHEIIVGIRLYRKKRDYRCPTWG